MVYAWLWLCEIYRERTDVLCSFWLTLLPVDFLQLFQRLDYNQDGWFKTDDAAQLSEEVCTAWDRCVCVWGGGG